MVFREGCGEGRGQPQLKVGGGGGEGWGSSPLYPSRSSFARPRLIVLFSFFLIHKKKRFGTINPTFIWVGKVVACVLTKLDKKKKNSLAARSDYLSAFCPSPFAKNLL